MKIFSLLFNSLIIAFTLSFLCFKWVWLEMRIDIGLLIPVFMLISFFIMRFAIKNIKFGNLIKIFTVIDLLICGAISALVLGRASVSVVPAAMIREALKMPHLEFALINSILVLLFIISFLIIVFCNAERKNTGRMIFLAMLLGIVCSYFLVPTIRDETNRIIKLFASGNIGVIKDFIKSYGAYAMAVSFLLMMFQSVLAPLPAFLITFANASLFGWWQGAILSWTSAMAGAAVCFYISRALGRDVAERFATKIGLAEIDKFFDRYGSYSIIIARLLPFISFDIVSYAAGLTSVGFISFLVATGIGQLPATIVYSYVGGMLTGGTKLLVTALLIIFALFTLTFLLKKMLGGRITKNTSDSKPASKQE